MHMNGDFLNSDLETNLDKKLNNQNTAQTCFEIYNSLQVWYNMKPIGDFVNSS